MGNLGRKWREIGNHLKPSYKLKNGSVTNNNRAELWSAGFRGAPLINRFVVSRLRLSSNEA